MLKNRKILKWFVENYIDDENQCASLLAQAERKYAFTQEQFYTGCFELYKLHLHNSKLETHLELLGVMSNVGIHSDVAGIKLRQAFLKSLLFPERILRHFE